MTRAERLTRVERNAPVLPVTRQCELLALPRSSAYYERGPAVSDEDLRLMRLLDELHLKYPFMGSRRLRDELKKLGVIANRKRVQRLMRRMGLEALYPRKRTSLPNKAHRVFPYLLRDLVIDRPNQVWATRHHLHPHAPRLSLPCGDRRLGEPGGVELAAVDHDGG